MNFFYTILIVTFTFNFVFAQKIQWADEVLSYSSQYGEPYYAAQQALGVPNACSITPLSEMAWVPKGENSNTEYIKVKFRSPMRGVRQILVAESLNPGAIAEIVAYDTKGKKHEIYKNKNPKAEGTIAAPFRLFSIKIPATDYYLEAIKIELKPKAVPGSNQIDAIGVSDSPTKIKIHEQINLFHYKEAVPRPENLGRQVNSNYAERLPIISPDGNTLYFARKYHPDNTGEENHDDIWVSYRQADDTWSHAKNIGTPLNDEEHNFVFAVSPDDQVLYLANDYNSRAKDGVSVSKRKRGYWDKPKAFRIEDHYNDNPYVVYHINTTGNILLMSVQRTEGYGDRDIYVSFLQNDGSWTLPRNLGPTINTVNIESSVFLAADGKTIYFSSNGHYGYGGLDMFVSKRLDDSWTNWSAPKNLGKNINTTGNDYNYTIPASGEYAYFSSDIGTHGMSDLFRIKLPEEARPEPVMLVSGRVIDAETQQPIKAKIKVRTLANDSSAPLETLENEDYKMVLPYGENISMYAEVEGYYPVSEPLENSLEELDQDGTTPSTDSDFSSFNNEKNEVLKKKTEVEVLKLESEIASLESEKKSYEPQKRKPTPTKRKPRNTTKDAELDYLRKKYYQRINKEDTPSDNLSNNENNTQNASSSPNTPPDDSELNSLKDKFNRHNNKDAEDTPPNNTPEVVADTDFTPTLATETPPSFDELESEVRTQLEEDLEAEVRKELQEDLLDEIKEELASELALELDESVRNQLRSDLEDEVAEDLRKELRETITEDLEEEVRADLEKDLTAEVEKDLRAVLEDDVKKDLKEELEEEIKAELRKELELRMKKELRAELQAELEKPTPPPSNERPTSTPSPDDDIAPTSTAVPEYAELSQDILVVPAKVGQVIPLNNLYFDANESSIKTPSYEELERVLLFLQKNNKVIVEVGGHTNGWCSHNFANELSQSRAKAVYEYLIEKGIPKHRIKFHGYGKTQPIADNNTKTGRKKNQRVELKILEILD